MSSRRVAVLGSNSFSGSDFVDHLLDDPNTEVLGISRSPEKGRLFLPYLEHTAPAFRFVQADFNSDMDRIVRELDTFEPASIVNFAAQSEVGPSWLHPEHWFQTNTVSLAKLVSALKDRKYVHRYVHISSPEAYGTCSGNVLETAPLNPSTPYAASKAAADLLLKTYAQNFDFPLITVRATNVYGAYQQLFKIIPRTVIRLKLDQIIELHGGGVAVKSFIHIRDVSRGEEAIMDRGRVGEIYHLSPDGGHAVRDVVERICTMMGRSFDDSTRAVAERLGQDAAYVIDSTKARTELGWLPHVSLDQGLQGVVNWIERYWDDVARQPHEYVHAP
jgi:dTDP-glucose 4,6-dehydratase